MIFPDKNQFINIHSHRKAVSNEEWTLRNAFHMLTQDDITSVDYAVSAGLHPWMVTDTWVEELKNLESLLDLSNVLAIGEIGLDRAIKTPIDQQTKAFEAQLELAMKCRKPVIIHAVRSYSDLLPYLRKYSQLKFILHDYRGNEQQTGELLKLPYVCFSFGGSIYKQNTKETIIFSSLPIQRIFLETDNAPLLISDVYQKASDLRNIEISELKNQFFDTFARIFNQ